MFKLVLEKAEEPEIHLTTSAGSWKKQESSTKKKKKEKINFCFISQIGNEVLQVCILSPCLFNLYAEYIMRNAGLEEAQVGIKIAGRNISNLRYADDTTLMAESEEELKKPLEESERGERTCFL